MHRTLILRPLFYLSILLILFIIPLPGSAQSSGRISGYLRDAATGEPVMYANIVLEQTDTGAAADVYGYYVIARVPPGEYFVKAMMLGYENQRKRVVVRVGEEQRVDFDLAVKAIETEAVTVTAERTRFEEKVEISRTNLSFREIKSAPAFIEADVFRSLQLLPGVSAQNDFSSALIVRGGSPDENLILLDGTEIYNPYHIGGVFSTFNADAISDAEFLAGGYPAEFGGRVSSVLQITSKEGNSKGGRLTRNTPLAKYWDLSGVKGEISALSSKIMAEGPFYKGSWILSTRRTYFDQLAKLYYWAKQEDQNWKYYFWDTQLKVISDLDKNNRLTFMTYNGTDRLAFKLDAGLTNEIDFDWNWGNNTSSLQWRYVPNARFFSETSIARTQYVFDVNLQISQTDSVAGTTSNQILVNNEVSDWTLKEKLSWYVSPAHTLTLGMDLKTLSITFKQKLDDVTYLDNKQSPRVSAFYLQDKWNTGALFSLQFGLRISKYELHKRLYAEPRFGFKYRLTEDCSIKGSWGDYYQFLFTTNDNDEILRIVDFWEPIPQNLGAIHNQHYILGIERWLGENFTASVETYYKPYANLLDLNPNNNPADPDDDFISGEGHAWGIELLLKRTSGKLSGWLGYSYSYTERRIDYNSDGRIDEDAGEAFVPKYYRPQSINLVLNYRLGRKNQLSLTWSLASGQPYTPVIGKVYTQSNFGSLLNPYEQLDNINGAKNSATLPTYIRGDIGWTRDISPFGIKGRLKAQVINFTNQFNVLLYNWDHSKSPSKVTAIGMFPIIPTFGLEFEL